MYFKIALGNVKKSFKDYSIYFLTITLAVAIFYSFNSIDSQKALVDLKSSTASYVEMLMQMLGYVSVFVSFILGSLILYANNFLIKKRKKELGTYMILGMGKSKISRILFIETFLVGIMSLVSGLLLGLVTSQGLSIFTSKLFDVSMNEFQFSISTGAIGKTLLYFSIIFILVGIFNTYVMSKYKIIDLLTANKKIEVIKTDKPIFYLITFIFSVISLGFAYASILETGLSFDNPLAIISPVIFGILGTFLFFLSLAGFGLFIFKNNKKFYFKDLNIFVVKQINSKVHTNYVSMSMICLMLFLTICILSTGISFKTALETQLEETTPFDASATVYPYPEDPINNIEQSLKNIGFTFNSDEEVVYFTEYDSNLTLKEFLHQKGSQLDSNIVDKFGKVRLTYIKSSEYNAIRKLSNQDSIQLNDNEILLLSNRDETIPLLNDLIKENSTIKLHDKEYKIKNDKVLEDTLETTYLKNMFLMIVVPDEMTANLEPYYLHMNVNFTGANKEKSEEKFTNLFSDYTSGKIDLKKSDFINGMTRISVYNETKGITTTILFIGIYLGIIFLISSMAVLALQQLSEASDSIERYKSLKRIGANDYMINKTIFRQTLIYFSLPIALALIHSVVGIKVANDFITLYNKPDIGGSSLITGSLFLAVYVIYFYATYTGYKNIIKQN
ncbi:MAG: FtsX-like permease family protein [Turicibacter sp.]